MGILSYFDPALGATRNVRAVQQGYTLYFNAQHLLLQLTPMERSFFDYLCERMRTDTNSVFVDKACKEAFIAHIERLSSKKFKPALNSLSQYVSHLRSLHLLIPMENSQRSYYFVNPKYAAKSTKKQRNKLWITLIESRSKQGLGLKGLIDTPIAVMNGKPKEE